MNKYEMNAIRVYGIHVNSICKVKRRHCLFFWKESHLIFCFFFTDFIFDRCESERRNNHNNNSKKTTIKNNLFPNRSTQSKLLMEIFVWFFSFLFVFYSFILLLAFNICFLLVFALVHSFSRLLCALHFST